MKRRATPIVRQSAYSIPALAVAVYPASLLLTGADSVRHRHGNYIDFSQLKPTSAYFLAPLPSRENQPCILAYLTMAIAHPTSNIQILAIA